MANNIIAACIIAVVAAFAIAGGAEAGGKGKGGGFHWGNHGNHHHWRHFRHTYPMYVETYSCSRFYYRWKNTGRLYWKKKYYLCKGWW